MVYQSSYFDRWLYHVAGWLKLAETSRNVTCISYAERLRNTKQTLVYSLDALSIPYNKIPILSEKKLYGWKKHNTVLPRT